MLVLAMFAKFFKGIYMTCDDTDFDSWFDAVKLFTKDAGISFHDADSVKHDYETGKTAQEVADSIIDEYSD